MSLGRLIAHIVGIVAVFADPCYTSRFIRILIADKLKRELNINLAIVELRNEFIIQISVSYGSSFKLVEWHNV